jgi:hypothetical protein
MPPLRTAPRHIGRGPLGREGELSERRFAQVSADIPNTAPCQSDGRQDGARSEPVVTAETRSHFRSGQTSCRFRYPENFDVRLAGTSSPIRPTANKNLSW